jgi:BirA family biotin operon repressor/biotin-[acetyl-CoA-carboxylase] ligase
MSVRLGISRAAVWKHVKALERRGYEIESVSGLGYRLSAIPDILDSNTIGLGLKTQRFGRNLETYETIDSTNSRAKILALDGAQEGTIVIADAQSAGRGRMDRVWISPSNKGLWMSIILKPPISPERAPELTVLAAIATVRALEDYTGLNTAIKWPNDIVINGRKLCGMLAEIQAEPEIIRSVVMGIGINVNIQRNDFPPELQDIATSVLIESDKIFSRRELLFILLENLESIYYEYLKSDGLAPFIEYYKSRSATLGRNVNVIERESSFEGYALDIDKSGALMVRKNDGSIKKILSADVSVRGEKGYV